MGLDGGELSQAESRLLAARCLAEQAYVFPYDVELDNDEELRERLTSALTLYNRALDYGGQMLPMEEKRSWYFKMAVIYTRLDDIVKTKVDSEYSRLSHYNKGLKLLKETLESERPQHKALAWCHIGIMLERKDDFVTVPMSVHDCGYSATDPLSCYATAIKLASDEASILNMLAKVCFPLGKHEMATGICNMALDVLPDPELNWQAYCTRAKINVIQYVRDLERAKSGEGGLPDRQNLTAARKDLDKVLSVRPCLRTHLEMAQVYYYMGVDALQESLLVDEAAVNNALALLVLFMQSGVEQSHEPCPAIAQLETWVKKAEEKYAKDSVKAELKLLYRTHPEEVAELARALIRTGRLGLVRRLLETVVPKQKPKRKPVIRTYSLTALSARMEEELQQLREQLARLKADNERLSQEGVPAQAGPSEASQASGASTGQARSLGVHTPITERVLVMAKDRKCPFFNGKSGPPLNEWIEEAQACMRARRLSTVEQAFFLFDHLEGEAKNEIKFRPLGERENPELILETLKDLYGCVQPYVTLQQAFFSRRQEEGETLQEFSLALMALMEQVKQSSPDGVPNSDVLLRDQFTEHVTDSALRRDLKRFIRDKPTATLLQVRAEAIRWEREGLPGQFRERSFSLPSVRGLQYEVRGFTRPAPALTSPAPGLVEVMELLKRQQEQLNQLTQTVSSLQTPRQNNRAPRSSIVCRRCTQLGHYASECDGERVSARPRANSLTGHSNPASHSGN
ncbi:hypothetical protein WMY93_024555 [Mugilogobius chulae]|uniref:CCHC-type domain-containing protein n=1 Tax=Mugilogobius chulae TaxID=88201 RepID=A0AAW0NAA6_9GOBI